MCLVKEATFPKLQVLHEATTKETSECTLSLTCSAPNTPHSPNKPGCARPHTHTHTQLAIHHMLLLSCLDLSVSSANTVPAIGCTGTEHVDKERSSWFCSLYFVLLLFIKSYCFLKLIYWTFRKWRMRSCLLIEAYSLADRRYYARYDCVKTFHKQDHLF